MSRRRRLPRRPRLRRTSPRRRRPRPLRRAPPLRPRRRLPPRLRSRSRRPRQTQNGLHVLADFRPWLEDRMVVRSLREMVMESETARAVLVLTAPRLPLPPELAQVGVTFDWPSGGTTDMDALYEEVAAEIAA